MLRIPHRSLGQNDGGAPYSRELTDVVRSFPSCITAIQAAEILERAAEFARKVGVDKAYLTSGVDPAPLARARQTAIDASAVWRGRAPWFWQTPAQYCVGSTEHKSVLDLVTVIYGESSSASGQQEVVQQAREQLVEDLKKPPAFGGLSLIQVAGITGAGLVLLWFVSRRSPAVKVEAPRVEPEYEDEEIAA